ncbi:MAG: DUF1837 domain-containing protein [Bacteroidota bacterium]
MEVEIDFEKLLPKMEAFIRTMHHVSMDLEIKPKKKHIGTCINYNDLIQLKEEFIKELLASVTRFVYSKAKGKEIVQKLETDHETEDAFNLLNQQAKDKFRPYTVQGQFSELLLFNLLQYHFKAVPLIRKMKITTNVQLERNGADAIHVATSDNKYILYLGEAKTYTSGFKAGFKKSLTSIVETFSKHRNELDLYKFEDFLEPELIDLATKYINSELDNIEVHMVCIVTFCVGDVPLGDDRQKTIDKYMSTITDEVDKIIDSDYPDIQEPILARINYIFMPVNGLEKLIEDFKKKLGV